MPRERSSLGNASLVDLRPELLERQQRALEAAERAGLAGVVALGRAFYDRPGPCAWLTGHHPPFLAAAPQPGLRGAGHAAFVLPVRGIDDARVRPDRRARRARGERRHLEHRRALGGARSRPARRRALGLQPSASRAATSCRHPSRHRSRASSPPSSCGRSTTRSTSSARSSRPSSRRSWRMPRHVPTPALPGRSPSCDRARASATRPRPAPLPRSPPARTTSATCACTPASGASAPPAGLLRSTVSRSTASSSWST